MITNWKTEWKPLALIAGLLLACYYLPVGAPRFDNAVTEAFELVKWYTREHVILCLIPALLLAGPSLSLQSMLVLRTVMGIKKCSSMSR